jgi:hypothetical protein
VGGEGGEVVVIVVVVIHESNGYVILSVAWYTKINRPLAALIFYYGYGFLINLYTRFMSHSFYMTKPFTFLRHLK